MCVCVAGRAGSAHRRAARREGPPQRPRRRRRRASESDRSLLRQDICKKIRFQAKDSFWLKVNRHVSVVRRLGSRLVRAQLGSYRVAFAYPSRFTRTRILLSCAQPRNSAPVPPRISESYPGRIRVVYSPAACVYSILVHTHTLPSIPTHARARAHTNTHTHTATRLRRCDGHRVGLDGERNVGDHEKIRTSLKRV